MSNARLKMFAAVLSVTLASGGFLFGAQNDGQGTKEESGAGGRVSHTQAAENSQDEGQRVFAENCSRCHNAPQGFSPRIAGTISRHMRVRANLSAEEERALLRFFNP
jgi:cytochrome c5